MIFSFIVFELFSCGKTNTNIENRINYNPDLWGSYLSDLQIHKGLDDHLFLFVYPTYCGDCLLELNEWNRYLSKISSDISLVVVERYPSRTAIFVERNNYSFSFYTDTAARVLSDSLVPSLPYKVYFNSDDIEFSGIIGDGYNVKDFLEN